MRLKIRSTTILCVRHNGDVAIASDGQVTMGTNVMKHKARKLRTINDGKILTGFAGATADALTLFEKFEGKLSEFQGNLKRASVELAKEWRTDRILRKLEALMIVVDEKDSFLISGTGDVIEPEDGILAIGSGGPFALAAARAMVDRDNLSAREIAERSMRIAAGIDIYTNSEIIVEEIKK